MTPAQLRQHAANCVNEANRHTVLLKPCQNLIAYLDKHPPMGESIWAVRQIREAVAAIVGPVQKVPENCGSGHCSCIECFKDKP